MRFIYLFIEEYHAACGTCGTISPRIAGVNYWSHRREDRVRKGICFMYAIMYVRVNITFLMRVL